MKYLITESQLNLISELERNWRDFEYEEQYDKLKGTFVPYMVNKFESYSEDDNFIYIYDSKEQIICRFSLLSGELMINRHFENEYQGMFPHPLWLVHGKYIMSDAFEYEFPDYKVSEVRSMYFS